MKPKSIRHICVWAALALLSGMATANGPPGNGSYQRDIATAMATMHAKMMAPPTGDADHDFVQMMVPHHQGAIDMAVAELRYGRNARLKRLAQEIIVQQQQEITVMRRALDDLNAPPPSASQGATFSSPSAIRSRVK